MNTHRPAPTMVIVHFQSEKRTTGMLPPIPPSHTMVFLWRAISLPPLPPPHTPWPVLWRRPLTARLLLSLLCSHGQRRRGQAINIGLRGDEFLERLGSIKDL